MRKPRSKTRRRVSRGRRARVAKANKVIAQANKQIRQLKQSGFEGSPAITYLAPKKGKFKKLKTSRYQNINDVRRAQAQAQHFLNAKTSTVEGARKNLEATLGTITRGLSAGKGTNIDVKVIYEGNTELIKQYFDLEEQITQALQNDNVYVSSDDVIETVNEYLDKELDELDKATQEAFTDKLESMLKDVNFPKEVVARLGF